MISYTDRGTIQTRNRLAFLWVYETLGVSCTKLLITAEFPDVYYIMKLAKENLYFGEWSEKLTVHLKSRKYTCLCN